MPEVRIYRPAKTAMQSGRRNTKQWILEFEPSSKREVEPLMGWISSADTRDQVRMSFDSKDEAVAFAEKNKYAYRIYDPEPRRIKPKSYAENFAFKRIR
jgi:hypothetical protein